MSICPVCRKCLGCERLLITHIDKEHHSFQPFKQLRAQIIFPFNCTKCNEHITDLKGYLIHMNCDHPDLFKQLVDNFYLFEEQNSLINIPRNWRYLPMRNESIEIPFEGEIMLGPHRKVWLNINSCLETSFLQQLSKQCHRSNLFIHPIFDNVEGSFQLSPSFLFIASSKSFFLIDFDGINYLELTGIINRSKKLFFFFTPANIALFNQMSINFDLVDTRIPAHQFNKFFANKIMQFPVYKDLVGTNVESTLKRPVNIISVVKALVSPMIAFIFIEGLSFFDKAMIKPIPGKIETTKEKELEKHNQEYFTSISNQMGFSNQRISKFGLKRLFKFNCPICGQNFATDLERFIHFYSHSPFPCFIPNQFRLPTNEKKKYHICRKDHQLYQSFKDFVIHLFEKHRFEVYNNTLNSISNNRSEIPNKEDVIRYLNSRIKKIDPYRDEFEMPDIISRSVGT